MYPSILLFFPSPITKIAEKYYPQIDCRLLILFVAADKPILFPRERGIPGELRCEIAVISHHPSNSPSKSRTILTPNSNSFLVVSLGKPLFFPPFAKASAYSSFSHTALVDITYPPIFSPFSSSSFLACMILNSSIGFLIKGGLLLLRMSFAAPPIPKGLSQGSVSTPSWKIKSSVRPNDIPLYSFTLFESTIRSTRLLDEHLMIPLVLIAGKSLP
mmetsp:Transcript_7690/g.10288  ORF Transcript_7690/g.10288 Transcript_7690/m.10288 type:complete len:216 (-) Transcript_7690:717-1364(-)